MGRPLYAGLGGLGAAFLGSLCCTGPLIAVAFGVGAGLGSRFEPLRPLFGALMVGLFAVAFYAVYGRRPAAAGDESAACGPGEACAVPRNRTRDKAILWSAAVLALVFWTFPSWSKWLV